MATKRDYYEVLGVPRNADKDQLKKAYRRLARQYHPDVSDEPGADEKFKEINEAYEVLADDQKRAAYDRYGHAATTPGGSGFQDFDFGNVADIFEEFFGMGRRRRGPRRGADLRYNLTISFEEAVTGVEKDIEVSRAEICSHCRGVGAEPGTQPARCSHCNGSGEVRRTQQSILGSFVNVTACPVCKGAGEVIVTPCTVCNGTKQVRRKRSRHVRVPAGVDNNTQIRLTGEGELGGDGGPAGNLYVVITVNPHPFFHRQGDDILLDMEINVAQAALGDEIKIPTVEGDSQLNIPAGTQSGTVFRLPGLGMPRLQRSGRGDELVVIQVAVPKKLNDEQRELFKQLSKTLGDQPVIPQRDKGFFSQLRDALGL